MSSNITAISSASPPPVRTELRPRSGPPEDAAQQAKNNSDPMIQSGIAPPTSETPPAKPATPGAKAQETKTLADAVDKLNQHFQGLSRTSLQFNIDDKADQLVVKVMDAEKDEMIRQIPPEEVLALATFLKEKAEKETQQMERAAGLAPETSPLEGWLLHAKA